MSVSLTVEVSALRAAAGQRSVSPDAPRANIEKVRRLHNQMVMAGRGSTRCPDARIDNRLVMAVVVYFNIAGARLGQDWLWTCLLWIPTRSDIEGESFIESLR
jgi:hypothetical protein